MAIAPDSLRGADDGADRPGSAASSAAGAPSDGQPQVEVRRLESLTIGSRALQRLTDLAVLLLGSDVAQVSLLGEVQTAVAVSGRPPARAGAQLPLGDSLCAVAALTAPEPLVVCDTRAEPRIADRAPVTSGAIGSYLGMPLSVNDGQVVGALCAYSVEPRNWTESDVAVLRQLAESAASELQLCALTREYEASRLRFELAIAAAEIGRFDWDLVTGELLWDDRLLELFGYSRASFEPSIASFEARLHPDDLLRVRDLLQRAIDTCGVYDAEYRVVLPTGETRWIRARGRALPDDTGTAVRLLGAAYDSTGQRNGDARVARVLESMSAAFFSLDRQWRFSYVNAQAERLLGRSRDELLGGEVWDLFPAAVGSEFEEQYRGSLATGTERVFEAYYPPPLDSWYEVRVWPGPDGLSVYFSDITERRAVEERARLAAERLRMIAAVSDLLTATLGDGGTEEQALQGLAELVVPILGDWAVVTLAESDGRMHDVGSWHRDPAMRDATGRYARLRLAALQPDAPVFRALGSGQVLTVEDVPAAVGSTYPSGEVRDLFYTLNPASAVALPLVARGRTLGALTVYRSRERPAADADDLSAARELAGRVALALDNSRLHAQQRQLAETLQRSMLTAPPEPDHAEIVVRYHPAIALAEVGGDWYDAFLQPSGATMLVIGDVVGHDTRAAAAMGQLRGLLRGIAYRAETGPAQVLTELDLAMRGLEVGAMATAAIVRIEQTAEERSAGVTRLRWSNAGHPVPLVRHADGRIEELAGKRVDLMLGVDPDVVREEWEVTVSRGATVLLYTDGLVEGRDLPFDDGVARLREALADFGDRPLDPLCDALLRRLRPGELQDDIALVALRLHPQDRPRPASARPAHVPPGVPPEAQR